MGFTTAPRRRLATNRARAAALRSERRARVSDIPARRPGATRWQRQSTTSLARARATAPACGELLPARSLVGFVQIDPPCIGADQFVDLRFEALVAPCV